MCWRLRVCYRECTSWNHSSQYLWILFFIYIRTTIQLIHTYSVSALICHRARLKLTSMHFALWMRFFFFCYTTMMTFAVSHYTQAHIYWNTLQYAIYWQCHVVHTTDSEHTDRIAWGIRSLSAITPSGHSSVLQSMYKEDHVTMYYDYAPFTLMTRA